MTTVPSSCSSRPTAADHGQEQAGPVLPGGRVPHDRAAEQSALGAAILSKDAIGEIAEALEPLGAAAFYAPAHETIWTMIVAMYASGTDVTSISLAHELTKRGDLERVGGATYLSQLIEACPSTALSVQDAAIVLDRAKLRRLQQTGHEIALMAGAGEGDADDILDAASVNLAQVTQATARASQGYSGMDEVFAAAVDEAETIESRKGKALGLPTGFIDLDSLTGGLHPGQMIVLAARPAMGKSTLAMDFVRAASVQHRRRSAFFSLEMSKTELGMRMISAEARVGLHHLRSGTMTPDDWNRVARVSDRIRTAPLVISDETVNTLTQIKALCRRLQQNGGLDLVVIDYLQLLQSHGRIESRQQEVSDISRNIKLMAKELNVPVIALSQLNRGPEQRQDKRPMVSDLRESGSIEQDADLVILLHREDAYDKESPRAGEADLIVAKHRNGPTATITVAFQGHYSRFVDMNQT
ncbi:replicative DNA helicase [Streptomyces sp. I6]|uniref:replicative DNA helicase n=1 Tax=Streptomyces sp. I6 TaxID=2483113 RepID=UPI000F44F31F|nr:replicative DNA helicase [Streptomyces sp. I6]RNL73937.1 replicative DNA helicase [Streptomyces sp. I6]